MHLFEIAWAVYVSRRGVLVEECDPAAEFDSHFATVAFIMLQ